MVCFLERIGLLTADNSGNVCLWAVRGAPASLIGHLLRFKNRNSHASDTTSPVLSSHPVTFTDPSGEQRSAPPRPSGMEGSHDDSAGAGAEASRDDRIEREGEERAEEVVDYDLYTADERGEVKNRAHQVPAKAAGAGLRPDAPAVRAHRGGFQADRNLRVDVSEEMKNKKRSAGYARYAGRDRRASFFFARGSAALRRPASREFVARPLGRSLLDRGDRRAPPCRSILLRSPREAVGHRPRGRRGEVGRSSAEGGRERREEGGGGDGRRRRRAPGARAEEKGGEVGPRPAPPRLCVPPPARNRCLGTLRQGEEEQKQSPWDFVVDMQSRKKKADATATAVLKRIGERFDEADGASIDVALATVRDDGGDK